jgi:hypothetical protein
MRDVDSQNRLLRLCGHIQTLCVLASMRCDMRLSPLRESDNKAVEATANAAPHLHRSPEINPSAVSRSRFAHKRP